MNNELEKLKEWISILETQIQNTNKRIDRQGCTIRELKKDIKELSK